MAAKLRPGVRADMERIQQIATQNSSAGQWSAKHYEEVFAEKSKLHLVLVLEEGERIQGFIVGRLAGDQWEIENIAIDCELHRQGLGRQLVCEFLQHARRSGNAVFLEVRESNLAARKLYERMGFTEVGRRKSYYQSPADDALILELYF
ncbi:MAG TPA: ribosomal protein S18-alanine N-acetyltransferase [Candidatus Angelobacter sp.]|nr:ribosomal protein S18-alanine N-acetyltransferase [Candidatus Angelobacter sp.]